MTTIVPIARELRSICDQLDAIVQTGTLMSRAEIARWSDTLRLIARRADDLEAPERLAAAERAKTQVDFILMTQGSDR